MLLRAADQHIWLNTDGAQFFYRVLGWLGFQLASSLDPRHQSQMHQLSAAGTQFHFQLTNSFQERLGFDITNGTTDFNQCYVCIASTGNNAGFDFISNVGDNLNGSTQIITTALFAQHVFIHTARGEVIPLTHGCADETLVVAEIQIGLSPIFCNKNFTMLEWAHSARIHVDVRVQLEHGNLQAACLKNGSKRSGRNAFSKRGNNTARDEYIARH